jgi:NAD(P)-dependent dehydrogenase (short-subunit alcohol dehydrogenase family)
MACDVSRVQDVERAAQGAEALWGSVDLLVNSAGVAAGGLVGDMPLEDWEWIQTVRRQAALRFGTC